MFSKLRTSRQRSNPLPSVRKGSIGYRLTKFCPQKCQFLEAQNFVKVKGVYPVPTFMRISLPLNPTLSHSGSCVDSVFPANVVTTSTGNSLSSNLWRGSLQLAQPTGRPPHGRAQRKKQVPTICFRCARNYILRVSHGYRQGDSLKTLVHSPVPTATARACRIACS